MGQATPFKPIALVVEDEAMQREMAVMLLEECGMGVIECKSAEAALGVLEKIGSCFSLMFTDVNLSGKIDGVTSRRPSSGCHVRAPTEVAPS